MPDIIQTLQHSFRDSPEETLRIVHRIFGEESGYPLSWLEILASLDEDILRQALSLETGIPPLVSALGCVFARGEYEDLPLTYRPVVSVVGMSRTATQPVPVTSLDPANLATALRSQVSRDRALVILTSTYHLLPLTDAARILEDPNELVRYFRASSFGARSHIQQLLRGEPLSENPLAAAHTTASRILPSTWTTVNLVKKSLDISQAEAERLVQECQHLVASHLAQELEISPIQISFWEHLEDS